MGVNKGNTNANMENSEHNSKKRTLYSGKKTTWTPVFIIILILVIGGVTLLLSNDADNRQPRAGDESTTTPRENIDTSSERSNWQQYTNDAYNFTIELPPEGWRIVEAPDQEISPMFNIIKEGTEPDDPRVPYNHFVNATYIGIYPHGIPTEGVIGETASSSVDFTPAVRTSRTYMLNDGRPWAVYAQFSDIPQSWQTYGFLWARMAIDGLEVTCYRDGTEIAQSKCDPMMGDELSRSGEVRTEDWNTIKEIMRSFEFHAAPAE